VGELAETVTVSGAAPLIDTQSVAKRHVFGREVIDALPIRKNWQSVGKTIVGVQMGGAPDVGGSAGELAQNISVHGGGQALFQIAGLNNINTNGNTSLQLNDALVEDIVYETSAISVESASGGIRANIIPKEGGNHFSGSLFGNWASRSLQGNNFSEDLRASGLPAPDRVDVFFDESAALGGPLVRDRLWFFLGHRYWGRSMVYGDIYFSQDPNAFVYNPDLSRPAILASWDLDNSLRLTWQATARNKFGLFYAQHPRCHCEQRASSNIAAEAGLKQGTPHLYMAQATWSAPVTNKLLFEAGANLYSSAYTSEPSDGFTNLGAYSVLDLSTGRRLIAPAPPFTIEDNYTVQTRGVINYVTGSHAVKGGVWFLRAGRRPAAYSTTSDTSLQMLNGVPQSVVVYTTPYTRDETLNGSLGLFLQDRWTLNRVTMDVGVRLDYLNWQVNAQFAPGGRWIGPRSFEPVYDVPNWKDLNPRLGLSYDLFGTGRTALKASVSRYVALEFGSTIQVLTDSNPINATVNSATRVWTDRNDDRLPQEDELGALSNPNFGKVIVRTRYDDSVRNGWFKRPYDWEYSASLQQQLGSRTSVDVGYYRRTNHNFTVSDNLAVTPDDYEPYCVTVPTDPRLPGGGGFQQCGLYDISPAAFVRSPDNLVKLGPEQRRIYDGIDAGLSVRVSDRLYVSGGVSDGRTLNENCAVVDSPQQLLHCKTSTGWQPIGRLSGSYTLPWWDVALGAVFQSNPGAQITAAWAVSSDRIAPSLGRNLAAGARATATVPLISPGTRYNDRLNQLDLRLSKKLSLGGARKLEVMADLYNALNANPVLTQNNTFGPEWQRPLSILLARFAKFGAQFTF
jgi:hypothetical protein